METAVLEQEQEQDEVSDDETSGFISGLVTTPPTKRKPSDFLLERQAWLLKTCRGVDTPTADDLKKHADRFGGECVVETAVELGYGLETCTRLMEYCDRVDGVRQAAASRFGGKTIRRSSAEERCKALLGIIDDEE